MAKAYAPLQVNGQTVQTVALPAWPGLRSLEMTIHDAVAANISPFTGQVQTYTWPGADTWCPQNKPGVATLPVLQRADADAWIAFLMACRGMANPFLLGDPLKTSPAGALQGSEPLYDNSVTGTNLTAQTALYTKGWTPSKFRLLHGGDYLQIGFRLHRVVFDVDSDVNGKAVLTVWPSLREPAPADVAGVAQPLILKNPRGLFRLATNDRTWSLQIGMLTSLSFQIMEYR